MISPTLIPFRDYIADQTTSVLAPAATRLQHVSLLAAVWECSIVAAYERIRIRFHNSKTKPTGTPIGEV
jgi:hypothetical protein